MVTPIRERPAPPGRSFSRGGGLLAVLEPIGVVVTLQLLAVLASLPVVTALPAVIAVRRGVGAVVDGDGGPTLARFFADTARSFVRLWPVCVLSVPAVAAWVLAVLFWSGRPAPVSWLAAGLLCALGGLVLATVLGAIAADTSGSHRRTRTWLRAGFDVVLANPLRSAGAVVLFPSWCLLVLRLPTVLLFGSAAVPALLAVWLSRPPVRRV